MKKYFLALLIFAFTSLNANADYLPNYFNPSFYYGNGIVQVNGVVPVYETNSEKSPLVAYIKVEDNGLLIKTRKTKKQKPENSLIAYNSENNLAFLSLKNDTDDWYQVCYDQKDKLFGWIKKNENIDYFSWVDFMNFYGRKNGIHLFRNIEDKYKKLYSKASTNSTTVDDFKFAKHIAIWLVEDEWLLVKVTTYENVTKTGWLKWKLEDGSIMAFPDFGYYY